MKITQEEMVERQTVLHVELEDEDLEPYLQRVYQRVAQQAAIPGFRKGKAPRTVVERFLGPGGLVQESLNDAVPALADQAVSARELDPAVPPSVDVLDMEPVTFKVTVASEPGIDLGEYRSIRLEESKVEIEEEDVEKALVALRRDSASWEPVERPVKLGDMVTIDVTGTVEERVVLDEKDTVYMAEDGSNIPFAGFSENLVEAVAGEPRQFSIPIPEDYADTSLAGKSCDFEVTVNEIKEQKLPDLDDEFAKGTGDGYETMAQLRESIEGGMRERAEAAERNSFRQRAVDALVEAATVEVAPLHVDHEVNHAMYDRARFVQNLNMPYQDYLRYRGVTEEQDREEMRGTAVRRLLQSYVVRTLAERESIGVSDDEIDDKLKEIMDSGGEAAAQLREAQDQDRARDAVRASLRVDKAVDLLAAIARGEEPPPGEPSETADGEDRMTAEPSGDDENSKE